uniref:Putative nucleoredoxin 1 n=1 Tax=Noccaea caerulescens TaxID=107243 RepID=A0A1J3I5G6_NOCCA
MLTEVTEPHTIQHISHNHPLTEVIVVGAYTCDGCKLYGTGKTYRCNDCDYDLHEYCTACPQTLGKSWHAPDHELSLINGPTHMTERGCYVCRAYIQGMFYKCKHCSFESHPLCAHGPMHASSPDATTTTKQRSLHDPAGQGQPSSPQQYGQGDPYGYAHMGPYGTHPHGGGDHQQQHPHMSPSSPKLDPKADSRKGKKKRGGFLGAFQTVVAGTATVAAHVAVAMVTGEFSA